MREITITILGAGAWGTALAQLARANGHNVRLWSRHGELGLKDALEGAQIVLSAISMQGVTAVATAIAAIPLSANTIFVTATKGLDPATTLTPAQIWQAVFPQHPVVVLCGPNLCKEIQQNLPAATVVASTDIAAAEVDRKSVV